MIRAIVAGSVRAPEQKQSKSGNPYTLVTIREGSGDKARWVRVFLFADEARAAVADMQAGDAIAVAGEIEAELYTPEGGSSRISWSIKADAVLTLKSGARKPSAEPRESRERGRRETRDQPPINDDIPF